MPKTPEDWLQETAPAAQATKGGIFKLFLGYAPGVGKTYAMLSEAIRRHERGEDVVVGVAETHGRKGVIELLGKLEVVPRRKLEYKGTLFDEMDVDAILARKPRVAVIDELAHTNVEGSRNHKRYQDVFQLLDAGISVLSTMNIQHLESISPTVENITGVKIRETVPDWVVQRAQEVVMSDLTPEALQTRMRRGDIYPKERTERALENFFRTKNIMALRELALRHVAQVVDKNLQPLLDKDLGLASGVRERIGVCVSSNPAAQHLVARGARMAQAMDAEFYVAYVEVPVDTSEENQRTLAANIRFAEDLGATIVRMPAGDVAERVAEFVREKHITQVIFGHSSTKGWRRYLYMSALHRFLRDAPPVDVHIVSQENQ